MSSSALSAGLRRLRGKLAARQYHADSDDQLWHAFTSRRDDNAFTVLVQRHGPMVLHVCRRVLGHEQDAEDAFQATFLVLAQSVASLRSKTSLAGFLHGIAYRTAMKAKQSAARRRKHEGAFPRGAWERGGEKQAPSRPPADPADELSWREARSLLDEEIARLPEIYRSVFVLCHLEDLSRTEAAQRLGLKECTLLSRLAEARKRLAQRLIRRGVELTAVLAASTLAAQPASALPAGLMASTIEAALATAAGESLAGIVSASVAQLVKSATAAMMVSKAKIVVVVLLTASMMAGASVWAYRGLAANALMPPPSAAEAPAAQADNKPRTISPKRVTTEAVEIQGRVVDPDGKPVRDAKLLFLFSFRDAQKQIPNKVWAKSGAEGRFRFTVPADQLGECWLRSPWEAVYVLAAADGYGVAVARLGKPGATDLMLRLVKDDRPIRGRVLNLEGKPVAGARVRIADALYIPKKDDLTTWHAAVKAGRKETDRYSVNWLHLIELYSLAFDLLIPPVTTGRDGRFQIKGIGRERLARLRIEGPTIATQIVTVQTRSDEAIHYQWTDYPKPQTYTYYGAALEILAAPPRSVLGVVRDKDTGKPLAGVKVETEVALGEVIRTTTDKDGRYRLDGLTKGGRQIMAMTDDMPYLPALRTVEDSLGLEAVTFHIALKRGVWIRGRVFDKATGKPHWADVEYHCFRDNPNVNELHSLPDQRIKVTRKDGSFNIVALPGRGLITAFSIDDSDAYVTAVGADKIKGFNPLAVVPGGRYLLMKKHTLVEINPKPDDESIICDVALYPGRTLAGRIVGPEGKPLAGARVCGLSDSGDWEMDPLPGAEFTVKALQPNKPRLVQFAHEGKKLSGFLRLRGNEKGTLQVRLERYGTLTGRLVTPDGKPMARAEVVCHTSEKQYSGIYYAPFQPLQPVKNGRFSIEGLAPGLKYELSVVKRPYELEIVGGRPKVTIKSGETKDLGDLQVKPME
ncbi:MAG TPA: sigma-70 family RNA polymerase sigma factor [Gemmataceae bacterium]|nr:sigma-70 family RNA polymerase sigma factor [Gemmataceae bacterium]